MGEIEEKIIAIRATTVSGLRGHAMMLQRYTRDHEEKYLVTRALRAMTRDLEAMGEQSA